MATLMLALAVVSLCPSCSRWLAKCLTVCPVPSNSPASDENGKFSHSVELTNQREAMIFMGKISSVDGYR